MWHELETDLSHLRLVIKELEASPLVIKDLAESVQYRDELHSVGEWAWLNAWWDGGPQP